MADRFNTRSKNVKLSKFHLPRSWDLDWNCSFHLLQVCRLCWQSFYLLVGLCRRRRHREAENCLFSGSSWCWLTRSSAVKPYRLDSTRSDHYSPPSYWMHSKLATYTIFRFPRAIIKLKIILKLRGEPTRSTRLQEQKWKWKRKK